MIDLYYWTTPNGHKITIFLEEAGLDYTIKPINISKGQQFEDDFLAISPNNKIPAIVDHKPVDGGEPLSIFESGAILWYLAEKTNKFCPDSARGKTVVSEWLFWQMASFGPMLGQNHHFKTYAPEKIEYAIDRYVKETERLYGVLDDRLDGRAFVAGDAYTIADMAIYPWARPHERQGIDLAEYPNVKRWFDAIGERPATKRAYEKAEQVSREETVTEESKSILFGQGRRRKAG